MTSRTLVRMFWSALFLAIVAGCATDSYAQFDKLKKKEKLPKSDLSTEAKALLRTVLVHRFAQYAETTDVAMNGTDSTAERRRAMAVQVIQGEQNILREAVEAVTESVNNKKRAADTLDDEAAAIRNPTKR